MIDGASGFTFGIPLIARGAAGDFARVEALLELTLASLLAQSDGAYRIVIAGHDRPRCAGVDARVSFVRVPWPPPPPDPHNADAARKREAIKDLVLARGGGLLMFVDADDWVDVRTVRTARAQMRPEHVGAVVEAGYAVDIRTLRAAPIPHRELFHGGLDRVCGSTTLVRLSPGARHPLRRDPYELAQEHHRFGDAARERGLPVLRLDLSGCYVVNTAENHSELHGQFASWRASFGRRLNALGEPLDAHVAARFGLDLGAIRSAVRRLGPPPSGMPRA